MSEALSTQALLLAIPIILVAYLVRGIAGFGSGLIAIPLLSLVLPLQVAVPLVVLLDYLASAGQGMQQRGHIAWPEIGWLLLPAMLGVVGGLYVIHELDAELLKRVLGGFLFIYALYSLWGPALPHASRFWALPAAVFGGSIGTLFGTGGPFYVTYLKARQLDKSVFRATFASIFMLDGAARIIGYASTSIIDLSLLKLLALCLPLMILAMLIGDRIHTNLSQRRFTQGISVLLLGSSSILLFS